jgi:hypothetical protein
VWLAIPPAYADWTHPLQWLEPGHAPWDPTQPDQSPSQPNPSPLTPQQEQQVLAPSQPQGTSNSANTTAPATDNQILGARPSGALTGQVTLTPTQPTADQAKATLNYLVQQGALSQATATTLLSEHGAGVVSNDGGSLLTQAIALQSAVNSGALTQAQADNATKLISEHGAGLIGEDGSGLIGEGGAGLTATQAKTVSTIISSNSGGIISSNSGGIISSNSGGIISSNSGGIISSNSGGIISSNSGGIISSNSGGIISSNSGGIISSNSGGIISSNSGGIISSNSGSIISSNSGGILGNEVQTSAQLMASVAMQSAGIVQSGRSVQSADMPDPKAVMNTLNASTALAAAVSDADTAKNNVSGLASLVASDRAALDIAAANKDLSLVSQLSAKLNTDGLALNNALTDYAGKNNSVMVAIQAVGGDPTQIQAQQLAAAQDYTAVSQTVSTAITNASSGLVQTLASVNSAAYVPTAAQTQAAANAQNTASAATAAYNAAFAAACGSSNCQRSTDPATMKQNYETTNSLAIADAQKSVAGDQKSIADAKAAGAKEGDQSLTNLEAALSKDQNRLQNLQNLQANNYPDLDAASDIAQMDLKNATSALAAFKQAYGGQAPTDPAALTVYNALENMVQLMGDQAAIAAANDQIAQMKSKIPPDTAGIAAQNAMLQKAQTDIGALTAANPSLASLAQGGIDGVAMQVATLVAPAVQLNSDQAAMDAIRAKSDGSTASTTAYAAAQSKLAADNNALSQSAAQFAAISSLAAMQASIAAVVAQQQQQILQRQQAAALTTQKPASPAPAGTPRLPSPSESPSPSPTPAPSPSASSSGPSLATLQTLVAQYQQNVAYAKSIGDTNGANGWQTNVDQLNAQIAKLGGSPSVSSSPSPSPSPSTSQSAGSSNPSVATLQNLAVQYQQNVAYAKSIGDTKGAAGWQTNVDQLNAQIVKLGGTPATSASVTPAASNAPSGNSPSGAAAASKSSAAPAGASASVGTNPPSSVKSPLQVTAVPQVPKVPGSGQDAGGHEHHDANTHQDRMPASGQDAVGHEHHEANTHQDHTPPSAPPPITSPHPNNTGTDIKHVDVEPAHRPPPGPTVNVPHHEQPQVAVKPAAPPPPPKPIAAPRVCPVIAGKPSC